MRKFLIITIFCLLCAIPVLTISWINRPKSNYAWMAQSSVAVDTQIKTKPGLVTLDPVLITAKPQTVKSNSIESEKVWVCKNIELLNGGETKYCDWY